MANIKSQIKRNGRTRSCDSATRPCGRRSRPASSGRRRRRAGAETPPSRPRAVKRLDKAAAKGVIHKNAAARRKSRLMKKLGSGTADCALESRIAAGPERPAVPRPAVERATAAARQSGQPGHQHLQHELGRPAGRPGGRGRPRRAARSPGRRRRGPARAWPGPSGPGRSSPSCPSSSAASFSPAPRRRRGQHRREVAVQDGSTASGWRSPCRSCAGAASRARPRCRRGRWRRSGPTGGPRPPRRGRARRRPRPIVAPRRRSSGQVDERGQPARLVAHPGRPGAAGLGVELRFASARWPASPTRHLAARAGVDAAHHGALHRLQERAWAPSALLPPDQAVVGRVVEEGASSGDLVVLEAAGVADDDDPALVRNGGVWAASTSARSRPGRRRRGADPNSSTTARLRRRPASSTSRRTPPARSDRRRPP